MTENSEAPHGKEADHDEEPGELVAVRPAPIDSFDSKQYRIQVASRCKGNLAAAIRDVPDDLVDMGDRELKKFILEHHQSSQTEIDVDALRLSFWREYDESLVNDRAVNTVNVITGIASNGVFTRICKNRPDMIAFMVKSPEDLQFSQMRLHKKATDRIDEILEVSAIEERTFEEDDVNGLPVIRVARDINVKLASLQFKIWKELQARVIGPIEQRQLHLHAKVPGGAEPLKRKKPHEKTALEIQAQLTAIEEQLRDIDTGKEINIDPNQVIDVPDEGEDV